jgi:hypothetical protein
MKMKILFLNINFNWVYNLFIEYITNSATFIKENYDNINIDIIHYDIETFKSLDIFLFYNYNKIIYTGDIKIFNDIINNILFINKKIIDKIYYLNIEQLSHPSYYKNFININTNIKIIDYSEENIPYIKNNYSKYFLLPPYFINENISIKNKDIDILSLQNNSYREDTIAKINEELLSNNLPEIKTFNNIYNSERDNIFKKTKIYINIHCSDEHKTMELIRISNLINKNVIIISYNTINSTLLFLNKSILIFNNIKDIITVIKDIYNNYDIYYDYYLKKYNSIEYNKYIKDNIDTIFNDS